MVIYCLEMRLLLAWSYIPGHAQRVQGNVREHHYGLCNQRQYGYQAATHQGYEDCKEGDAEADW